MGTSSRLVLCAFAAGWLALVPVRAVSWDPVPAADLAPGTASIEAEAPAEAIFRRIAVDDSDFPQTRRVQEYDRFKIFDPAKAIHLTRVAQFSITANGQTAVGDVRIAARLTNPDGTVHLFGRESLQVRPIVRNAAEQSWLTRLLGAGGLEVNETFLAISGIETGAVLDIQTSHVENSPQTSYIMALQQEGVPARQLNLRYRTCTATDEWNLHEFTLNSTVGSAAVTSDHGVRIISLQAHDLPGLYREPFSGPTSNYALTFVMAYTPAHSRLLVRHGGDEHVEIDPKTAPWGLYASRIYFLEKDRTWPTRRIRELAASLTAGSGTEPTKAAAIHRYVQELHQRFLHRPKPASGLGQADPVESLDDILDFERLPHLGLDDLDFLWLAIALFRSAGWETQAVMLPNRNRLPFDPRIVADLFLPTLAARVRLAGQWYYSDAAGTNRDPCRQSAL